MDGADAGVGAQCHADELIPVHRRIETEMNDGKKVLIAGATGLVGRELLRLLLDDKGVKEVHVLTRRPLDIAEPKAVVHVVDFHRLPQLPGVDEVYLALGTTIRAAGSRAAFRAVDFDANLAVARAGMAAGARRVALVSAMAADARSRVFYSRVKGELEEALRAMPCESLVVARPSLLLGDRASLGQRFRLGEWLSIRVARLIQGVLPRNYRPIDARSVAAALVSTLRTTRGISVLPSSELGRIATSPAGAL